MDAPGKRRQQGRVWTGPRCAALNTAAIRMSHCGELAVGSGARRVKGKLGKVEDGALYTLIQIKHKSLWATQR